MVLGKMSTGCAGLVPVLTVAILLFLSQVRSESFSDDGDPVKDADPPDQDLPQIEYKNECSLSQAAVCTKRCLTLSMTALVNPPGWDRQDGCRQLRESWDCIQATIVPCDEQLSYRQRYMYVTRVVEDIFVAVCKGINSADPSEKPIELPNEPDSCQVSVATECITNHVNQVLDEPYEDVCRDLSGFSNCVGSAVETCSNARQTILMVSVERFLAFQLSMCNIADETEVCHVTRAQNCISDFVEKYEKALAQSLSDWSLICIHAESAIACVDDNMEGCPGFVARYSRRNLQKALSKIVSLCDSSEVIDTISIGVDVEECYKDFVETVMTVLKGDSEAKSCPKSQQRVSRSADSDTKEKKSQEDKCENQLDCDDLDKALACLVGKIDELPASLRNPVLEIGKSLASFVKRQCKGEGHQEEASCHLQTTTRCVTDYLNKVITSKPDVEGFCADCNYVEECVKKSAAYCSEDTRMIYSSVVDKFHEIREHFCSYEEQCQPDTALRCVFTLSSLTTIQYRNREGICSQASKTVECVRYFTSTCKDKNSADLMDVWLSLDVALSVVGSYCPSLRRPYNWDISCSGGMTMSRIPTCDSVAVGQCVADMGDIFALSQISRAYLCRRVTELMHCVQGNSTGCSYDEEMESANLLAESLEQVGDQCADELAEEDRCAEVPRPCHLERAISCNNNFTQLLDSQDDVSILCPRAKIMLNCFRTESKGCLPSQMFLGHELLTANLKWVSSNCPDLDLMDFEEEIKIPANDPSARLLVEFFQSFDIFLGDVRLEMEGTSNLFLLRRLVAVDEALTKYQSAIPSRLVALIVYKIRSLIVPFFEKVQMIVDETKPGVCPAMNLDDFPADKCLDECSLDKVCDDGMICCSVGCHQVCKEPQVTAQGDCLSDPEAMVISDNSTCLYECRSHEDCPVRHTCCTSGCGMKCLEQVVSLQRTDPLPESCDVVQATKCVRRYLTYMANSYFVPLSSFNELICSQLTALEMCLIMNIRTCPDAVRQRFLMISDWGSGTARAVCEQREITLPTFTEGVCLPDVAHRCIEDFNNAFFRARTKTDQEALCSYVSNMLDCVKKTGLSCTGQAYTYIESSLAFTISLLGDNCEYDLSPFSGSSIIVPGTTNRCSFPGHMSCEQTAESNCEFYNLGIQCFATNLAGCNSWQTAGVTLDFLKKGLSVPDCVLSFTVPSQPYQQTQEAFRCLETFYTSFETTILQPRYGALDLCRSTEALYNCAMDAFKYAEISPAFRKAALHPVRLFAANANQSCEREEKELPLVCRSCERAESEEDCQDLEVCTDGRQSCVAVTEEKDGVMLLTRGCMHTDVCRDRCQGIPGINRKCWKCCDTPACNSPNPPMQTLPEAFLPVIKISEVDMEKCPLKMLTSCLQTFTTAILTMGSVSVRDRDALCQHLSVQTIQGCVSQAALEGCPDVFKEQVETTLRWTLQTRAQLCHVLPEDSECETEAALSCVQSFAESAIDILIDGENVCRYTRESISEVLYCVKNKTMACSGFEMTSTAIKSSLQTIVQYISPSCSLDIPEELTCEEELLESGGKTKESGGKTKESGGKTKESGGKTKESGGKTKESGGKTKESGGKTKESGGKKKESGGKTKESGGKTKEEYMEPGKCELRKPLEILVGNGDVKMDGCDQESVVFCVNQFKWTASWAMAIGQKEHVCRARQALIACARENSRHCLTSERLLLYVGVNSALEDYKDTCDPPMNLCPAEEDRCEARKASDCVRRLKDMLSEDDREIFTNTDKLCQQVLTTKTCVQASLRDCNELERMYVNEELSLVMELVSDQCEHHQDECPNLLSDFLDNILIKPWEQSEKNTKEKSSKDSDSSESKTKENTKEKNTKEKSTKEKSTKEKSTKEKSTKEKSTKEKSTKEKNTKEKNTKENNTKEKNTKEKNTKEKSTKEKSTKEKSTKEKSTKEKNTKEKNTKEKSTKEKSTKEKSTKEKSTKEKSTKEKNTKEKSTKEKNTKESKSKESNSKESKSKESTAEKISGELFDLCETAEQTYHCLLEHIRDIEDSDLRYMIEDIVYVGWSVTERTCQDKEPATCLEYQSAQCILGFLYQAVLSDSFGDLCVAQSLEVIHQCNRRAGYICTGRFVEETFSLMETFVKVHAYYCPVTPKCEVDRALVCVESFSTFLLASPEQDELCKKLTETIKCASSYTEHCEDSEMVELSDTTDFFFSIVGCSCPDIDHPFNKPTDQRCSLSVDESCQVSYEGARQLVSGPFEQAACLNVSSSLSCLTENLVQCSDFQTTWLYYEKLYPLLFPSGSACALSLADFGFSLPTTQPASCMTDLRDAINKILGSASFEFRTDFCETLPDIQSCFDNSLYILPKVVGGFVKQKLKFFTTFTERTCETKASTSISCYTCHRESDNDDCNGIIEQCSHNKQSCETVVDVTNSGVVLSKGCKNPNACKSGSNGSGKKTWYCCDDNLCNQPGGEPLAQSPDVIIQEPSSCDLDKAAECLSSVMLDVFFNPLLPICNQDQICPKLYEAGNCVLSAVATCSSLNGRYYLDTMELYQSKNKDLCKDYSPDVELPTVCAIKSAEECVLDFSLGLSIGSIQQESACVELNSTLKCVKDKTLACVDEQKAEVLRVYEELRISLSVVGGDCDYESLPPEIEPVCNLSEAEQCVTDYKADLLVIDGTDAICNATQRTYDCISENSAGCTFLQLSPLIEEVKLYLVEVDEVCPDVMPPKPEKEDELTELYECAETLKDDLVEALANPTTGSDITCDLISDFRDCLNNIPAGQRLNVITEEVDKLIPVTQRIWDELCQEEPENTTLIPIEQEPESCKVRKAVQCISTGISKLVAYDVTPLKDRLIICGEYESVRECVETSSFNCSTSRKDLLVRATKWVEIFSDVRCESACLVDDAYECSTDFNNLLSQATVFGNWIPEQICPELEKATECVKKNLGRCPLDSSPLIQEVKDLLSRATDMVGDFCEEKKVCEVQKASTCLDSLGGLLMASGEREELCRELMEKFECVEEFIIDCEESALFDLQESVKFIWSIVGNSCPDIDPPIIKKPETTCTLAYTDDCQANFEQSFELLYLENPDILQLCQSIKGSINCTEEMLAGCTSLQSTVVFYDRIARLLDFREETCSLNPTDIRLPPKTPFSGCIDNFMGHIGAQVEQDPSRYRTAICEASASLGSCLQESYKHFPRFISQYMETALRSTLSFADDICTDEQPLSCYTCHRESDNDDCNERIELCPHNKQSCETVVDVTNSGVLLSKGCKNPNACKSGSNGSGKKTGYCCDDNLCNQPGGEPLAQSPDVIIQEPETCGLKAGVECLGDVVLDVIFNPCLPYSDRDQICLRLWQSEYCVLETTARCSVSGRGFFSNVIEAFNVRNQELCEDFEPPEKEKPPEICAIEAAQKCVSNFAFQLSVLQIDADQVCIEVNSTLKCVKDKTLACVDEQKAEVLRVYEELRISLSVVGGDCDYESLPPEIEPVCNLADAEQCVTDYKADLLVIYGTDAICNATQRTYDCISENSAGCTFLQLSPLIEEVKLYLVEVDEVCPDVMPPKPEKEDELTELYECAETLKDDLVEALANPTTGSDITCALISDFRDCLNNIPAGQRLNVITEEVDKLIPVTQRIWDELCQEKAENVTLKPITEEPESCKVSRATQCITTQVFQLVAYDVTPLKSRALVCGKYESVLECVEIATSTCSTPRQNLLIKATKWVKILSETRCESTCVLEDAYECSTSFASLLTRSGSGSGDLVSGLICPAVETAKECVMKNVAKCGFRQNSLVKDVKFQLSVAIYTIGDLCEEKTCDMTKAQSCTESLTTLVDGFADPEDVCMTVVSTRKCVSEATEDCSGPDLTMVANLRQSISTIEDEWSCLVVPPKSLSTCFSKLQVAVSKILSLSQSSTPTAVSARKTECDIAGVEYACVTEALGEKAEFNEYISQTIFGIFEYGREDVDKLCLQNETTECNLPRLYSCVLSFVGFIDTQQDLNVSNFCSYDLSSTLTCLTESLGGCSNSSLSQIISSFTHLQDECRQPYCDVETAASVVSDLRQRFDSQQDVCSEDLRELDEVVDDIFENCTALWRSVQEEILSSYIQLRNRIDQNCGFYRSCVANFKSNYYSLVGLENPEALKPFCMRMDQNVECIESSAAAFKTDSHQSQVILRLADLLQFHKTLTCTITEFPVQRRCNVETILDCTENTLYTILDSDGSLREDICSNSSSSSECIRSNGDCFGFGSLPLLTLGQRLGTLGASCNQCQQDELDQCIDTVNQFLNTENVCSAIENGESCLRNFTASCPQELLENKRNQLQQFRENFCTECQEDELNKCIDVVNQFLNTENACSAIENGESCLRNFTASCPLELLENKRIQLRQFRENFCNDSCQTAASCVSDVADKFNNPDLLHVDYCRLQSEGEACVESLDFSQCSATIASTITSFLQQLRDIPDCNIPLCELNVGDLSLSEGETVNVQLTCKEDPNLFCDKAGATCNFFVTLSFYQISGTTPKCDDKVIPQLVVGSHDSMIGTDSCGIQIDSSNWNSSIEIPITAVVDGKFDGQQNWIAYMEMTKQYSGAITDTYTNEIAFFSCSVGDMDRTQSTCSIIADPHFVGFDGRYLNVYSEGEFVAARHTSGSYEVHVWFQQCGNDASCTCAVAVRSGDDVFVVDGCSREDNPDFPMDYRLYKNGDLTPGLQIISENDGKTHKIILPSGTFVLIEVTMEIYLNVWIRASPSDLSATEGLCGVYDWNVSNDLRMADGELFIPENDEDLYYPRNFSRSWRVDIGDTYIEGVAASSDNLEVQRSCVCPSSFSSGETTTHYCDNQLHISTCDLIIDPEFQTADFVDQAIENLSTRQKRAVFSHPRLNLNFDPPIPTWSSELARQEAFTFCDEFLFQNFSLSRACGEAFPALDLDFARRACMDDIQVSGGRDFAMSAWAGVRYSCTQYATRTVALPESLIAYSQSVISLNCLENCNGNGNCTNGICECNSGYVGRDCSVASPPSITSITGGPLCDTNSTDDCLKATLRGDNFVNLNTLACRTRRVKISSTGAGIPNSDISSYPPAQFWSFTKVTCQIFEEKSSLNAAVVSVSNTGNDFGPETLYVTYDSACYDCSVLSGGHDVACTLKGNTCDISGQCYQEGEAYSQQEPNLQCQPSVDQFSWTNVSPPRETTTQKEETACDSASRCVDTFRAVPTDSLLSEICRAGEVALECLELYVGDCNIGDLIKESLNLYFLRLNLNCELPRFLFENPSSEAFIKEGEKMNISFSLEEDPSLFCSVGATSCEIHLYVEVTDDLEQPLRCTNSGKTISQVVIGEIGSEPCVMRVTSANWNQAQAVPIRGRVDSVYDGRGKADVTLVASLLENGAVKHESRVKTVTVYVQDEEVSYSTCAALTDPHFITVDGRYYSNHLQGEFILYKHKTLPYEVHVVLQACYNGGQASCTCAVAVRAGDDVFYMNRCREVNADSNSNPLLRIRLIRNGPLTRGMSIVSRNSGKEFDVTLPHGALVRIQATQVGDDLEDFFNVWIKPSALDFDNMEGLCGTYTRSIFDDLIMRNGTDYAPSINGSTSRARFPNEMSITWRVGVEESLLDGVDPDDFVPETHCTCPSPQSIEANGSSQGCEANLLVETCNLELDIEMDTEEFIKRSISTVVLRRRKRAITEPLLSKLDVDYTYNPPDYFAWPTPTGWTEERAEEYCVNYINKTSKLPQLCSQLQEFNYQSELTACVEDIQLTGGTEWAEAVLDSIRQRCVQGLDLDFTATNTNNNLAHDIRSAACLSNCHGHGQCVEGKCVCNEGFEELDCSVKTTEPPFLARFDEFDTMCESSTNNCTILTLLGNNFAKTSALTCNIEEVEIDANGAVLRDESNVKVSSHPAQFLTFQSVECDIRQSDPVANRPILVSLSNSHGKVSRSLVFMVYHEDCYSCDSKLRCTRKRNTCVIDGKCYIENEPKPGDNCKTCKPDIMDDQWTYKTECSVSRGAEPQLSTTDVIIIASVSAAVLLIIVIIIGVVTYMKRRPGRKSHSSEDLVGPSGLPSRGGFAATAAGMSAGIDNHCTVWTPEASDHANSEGTSSNSAVLDKHGGYRHYASRDRKLAI